MDKINRLLTALAVWRSIPVIAVYLTLSEKAKSLVQADLARMGKTCSLFGLHEALLNNAVFRRQFFVRIHSESVMKYRLVRWTYRPLDSLEISAVTNQIGGGLMVYHGYSTIIFCHSMGKNCTVYQNVTIGRGKMIDGIDVPIIGNNVTIYAGAIVIGGIHIGDNVKIGAGAVVVKDVPANSTVVGQAGRIIKGQDN